MICYFFVLGETKKMFGFLLSPPEKHSGHWSMARCDCKCIAKENMMLMHVKKDLWVPVNEIRKTDFQNGVLYENL